MIALQEAKQKGSELLSKAGLMLAEHDEIKKLNESVLNAKCHAIRDLQLREKGELQEAMEDEQHRLDLMMEVERTRALRENEQKGFLIIGGGGPQSFCMIVVGVCYM